MANTHRFQRQQTLKMLLEKACDPDLVDADGRSALHYAAEAKNAPAAALLLRYGARLPVESAGVGAAAMVGSQLQTARSEQPAALLPPTMMTPSPSVLKEYCLSDDARTPWPNEVVRPAGSNGG